MSTGTLANVDHLSDNPKFSIEVASVLDYQSLERLIDKCDRIFHLAAAVGVKLIMEKPVETIVTNVRGTENVLKLASYYNKKVLIASTSEVYGKLMQEGNGINKLSEDGDWQLGPTSKRRWAYACSKAVDEFLSIAYYDEKKLSVVVARFFNTVGPRQTGTYGMVIPNFVQNALSNNTITVHGDGEQTRCFTYVTDTVDAIVKLIEKPSAEGKVFNIGSNDEISMNDLAKKVKRLAGSKSDIIHIPYEEVYGKGFEDMRRRTPDLKKIKEAIKYKTRYSIDDILINVIKYFENESQIVN